MLADRRQHPPSLRAANAAVPPGVEAIVQKCLAPDPADRYQTADDLRDDIELHLSNRPLRHAPNRSLRERARKWSRRHPKLASSGTVAVAAALMLVMVGSAAVYSRERSRGLEARDRLADHVADFRDVQVFLDDRTRSWPRLDEALEQLRAILARYEVAEDGDAGWLATPPVRYLSDSDQVQVRQDIGEVYFLMAQVALLKVSAATDAHQRTAELGRAEKWNQLAMRHAGDRLPRAIRDQRAAVAELRGDAERDRLRAEAAAAEPRSARDRYLAGAQLAHQGRYRDALPILTAATRADPGNFSAWFVRGTTHLAREENDLAAMCFGACTALRPQFAPAWLNRGLCFSRLRRLEQARDDYDRAIELDPRMAEAYIQRAGVRERFGDRDGALADFTRALETGSAPVRVHFLRASLYERLGDKEQAKADREAGLRITPSDELSWVARGEARAASDANAALADAEEALKLNPFSATALQLKAHLLSEKLNRRKEAIAVLDRAVEFYPDYVPARAGRGVLLAREGQREAALRDARDSLLRDTNPPNLYQVGCIYSLTSTTQAEDRREAYRLIWSALQRGFGHGYLDTDPDLDPLRDAPEFQRLVSAAKAKK
jgi:tetratricopeptide (TPR) repeat protein